MLNFLIAKLSIVSIVLILIAGAIFVGLAVLFFVLVPFLIWFKAVVAGAHIPMKKLAQMKISKHKIGDVVFAFIKAKKSGLVIDLDELLIHQNAGGNVESVVKALIVAKESNINLSFAQAKAIDISGKDVCELVKTCTNPKIIETLVVSAISKDQVELKLKSKITIRSNVHRLLGGVGEDTIIARVSEAIVSTVGSATTHMAVIENPDLVSKEVSSKGLDAGSCFEILSIDIFEIEIGQDFGAEFKKQQIEIDQKTANAKAEERKLIAMAVEQELKAKTEEARTKAIEAEIEMTKTVANSISSGSLSALDFFNIQNLQADTKMKNSIVEKDNKKDDFDF